MPEAVIFDMDGVLIDSEPLWQEAEIAVFASVGIRLSREECMETMGMRVDEVVRYRFEKEPWKGKTCAEIENEIVSRMVTLILQRGEKMPGVDHVLTFFQKCGLRLALASSSYLSIIKAVLSRLKLEDYFEVIHSGEFEPNGKPDPAIYRTTIQKLGLAPDQIIAIEDSYNGLLSAKRAGLTTIVIPESEQRNNSKFDIADCKISSLSEINETLLKQFQR